MLGISGQEQLSSLHTTVFSTYVSYSQKKAYIKIPIGKGLLNRNYVVYKMGGTVSQGDVNTHQKFTFGLQLQSFLHIILNLLPSSENC